MGAYDTVTLVDRTGLGGVDIIFDGAIIKFAKGQTEKAVPQVIAEWLFRVDQHKVHTTDGEYVQRFGIKDPPEDMVRSMGEEPDCSPITIDKTRVEGWDTDRFVLDRGEVRVRNVKQSPADFTNDATPGGFGKAR
jgi:hypothetical protein